MERGPMLRNLSTAALGTLVATALLAAAQPARAQGDEPLGKSLNESKRATLEVQVWLARANASPGPFDGLEGKNTELAIRAFQKMQDAEATGTLTDEQRATLKSKHGETPLLVEYEITQDDVKGPFLDKIPGSMQEMAELERLSFTSAKEMLAEKFQSYPDLLDELNPEANYDEAGGMIIVPNVDGIGPPPEVARIEINREDSTLFAYDGDDKLIAAYPATVGSDSTPSPSGEHTVKAVAPEPKYYYNPKELDFKGVEAKEQLVIPSGPNNPVGIVWIDLSEEGYGIHGTPSPTEIRRQASHGCVRLTNWDAQYLSKAVEAGTKVVFVPLEDAEKGADDESGADGTNN
jgi:lipoprotein-anchoring transpeptidase ErfK/SrfK